jgi:protein-disulfide isomerase
MVCAFAADPLADATVAVIGNRSITYSQLQQQIADSLEKQQQTHDMKRQQLDVEFMRTRQTLIETEAGKLVDNRVLALEAAAKKKTLVELLSALKPAPVTDADVHAFYDSQKAQFSQPFERLAPQIRQYLENQAADNANRKYFDSLRAKYKATVTLEPLREEVDATGPQRGAAAAPVTIVEFSDFQCPFCARYTPVLSRILAAYPSQVRLLYRYYPLTPIHPNAQKAAEAAVCADKQGKFWEMHDTLFAEQGALDVTALKEKAKRLGLDSAPFDECLDGGKALDVISADVKAGLKLGLDATPASFVNGRFVSGAATFEQLSALINDELSHKGAPTARQ